MTGPWISLHDVFREHELETADYLIDDSREARLASLPPDAPDIGDGRAAGRSARWKTGDAGAVSEHTETWSTADRASEPPSVAGTSVAWRDGEATEGEERVANVTDPLAGRPHHPETDDIEGDSRRSESEAT